MTTAGREDCATAGRASALCCKNLAITILTSERCYDEVCDRELEASSSSAPVPTVSLANRVEMPLLGLVALYFRSADVFMMQTLHVNERTPALKCRWSDGMWARR
ncbi:hypothetical protein OSTOST_15539 [Ostertagia ostertagi]